MSHARQCRCIARTFAALLGAAAGVDAVNDFATGGGGCDEPPTAADLYATLRSSWDAPAIDAGAARIDRCPVGYEGVYYDAYESAARAQVRRLADIEGRINNAARDL